MTAGSDEQAGQHRPEVRHGRGMLVIGELVWEGIALEERSTGNVGASVLPHHRSAGRRGFDLIDLSLQSSGAAIMRIPFSDRQHDDPSHQHP